MFAAVTCSPEKCKLSMLTTRHTILASVSPGPCLRCRPGISIQSLIYLKLVVCFLTGVGTGDLIIACVYIQFKTEGMQLAYPALPAQHRLRTHTTLEPVWQTWILHDAHDTAHLRSGILASRGPGPCLRCRPGLC